MGTVGYHSKTTRMPLPRGVTTVHAQVRASHERRGIGEQEDRCTTVLLGTRQTAKHILLGPLVAALRELNKQLLNHSGDDVTRGNSVDTDIVLAPFGSEVATKLDDGGLGGVVGGTDEALLESLLV